MRGINFNAEGAGGAGIKNQKENEEKGRKTGEKEKD
jgi:hypothetical protein